MDKDPGFLFHTFSPLNAEPPLDKLRNNFITPNKLFYIRNHGEIPQIDSKTFRLIINGMVHKEIELSHDSLMTDFPRHTVMATLQCAGNRRSQLNAVAPVPGEVPWQSGAIGNATWSGVPLKNILQLAGAKPEALFVEFMGAEEVYRHGKNVGFGASIPIEKAMTNDVLLAYEMNGKPLEPTHGFPLRAVVPGYIGARSVKWLNRITLQEKPSENYFQTRAYRLFPPHVNHDTVDWDAGEPLSELNLNCIITSPQNNEMLHEGACKVQGLAITGGNHKITGVEISINGGQTWNAAVITKSENLWSWVFWETELKLTSGKHEIIARAYDSSFKPQPVEPQHTWNFKGYMNNAWHRVTIWVK